MNSGRTIFAQLSDHLPIHEFRKCVARYEGDYRVRTFSCWDQFLCMAFAQLGAEKVSEAICNETIIRHYKEYAQMQMISGSKRQPAVW